MKFFLVSILAGSNLANLSSAELLLRRATSNGMHSEFGVDRVKSFSMSMMASVAAANKSSKTTKTSKSSKKTAVPTPSPTIDWCPDSPLPTEISPFAEAMQAIRGDGKSRNKIGKNKGLPFEVPNISSEEGIDEIVGGMDVDPPRKYKFFAYLNGCAATLIASNMLLSAAHCAGTASKEDGDVATLGLHRIIVEEDDAEEFDHIEHIPIKQTVLHPCYQRNAFAEYDFMVTELEWSTEKYKDYIVELDSPTDDLDLDDGEEHKLTVIGFGTLFKFGPTVPTVLQEVTVDYLGSSCGETPPSWITDSMFCASNDGLSACNGDSGGPILDIVTGKQVGVVSWGASGCGKPGFPGVYARVSTAHGWIDSYMAQWANEVPAPAPAPGICVDDPEGWFNFIQRKWLTHSCLWYALDTTRCTEYGEGFANGGITANEACCVCAPIDYPNEVSGYGAGPVTFDVTFGYDGSYAAASHGLVPASITSDIIGQDEEQVHPFSLSGAAFFRVALATFSVEDPNIDLDLALLDPDFNLISISAKDGMDEVVEVLLPVDGTWYVLVYGWNTIGSSVEYDMYSWIVSKTPGGNMNLDSSPTSAELGATEPISISWPGASLGEWYLGAVSHTGKHLLRGLTLVNVNNRGPLLYPDEIDGTGVTDTNFDVTFVYDGSYTALPSGLVPATVTSGAVVSKDHEVHQFDLTGAAFFRAVLPPVDDLGVDLNLYLVDPLNQPYAESENGGTDELVEVFLPAEGVWSVYVYRRDIDGTGMSAEYDMYSWIAPEDGGSMTVDSAPGSAQFGETGTISLSWPDTDDVWSLGAVSHANGTNSLGWTFVNVDNRKP